MTSLSLEIMCVPYCIFSDSFSGFVQVKQHKAQQRPIASRGSPQLTSPLGLMVSTPGSSGQIFDHPSPSTETPNRWYKPEIANPSPIRNIQKEEEAMKDLRRLYKSVKIVSPMDN